MMRAALLIDYANANSVKCLIADKEEELNGLGRSAIFLIDVPRAVSLQKNRDIYAMIESIKDGSFMSCKYKPKAVRLTWTPHIFLFTNELLVVDHMTSDRFECNTIDNEDRLVPNTLILDEQIRVANEQYERQQQLLQAISTRPADGPMDRIFERCFEIEEGSVDKWHVKRMLTILNGAVPQARA